jgi:L-ascorbate metabolism protein UlaG (beta-lactamase superfamily)
MRLTKYGHSCLLVEEGLARLLLDPGMHELVLSQAGKAIHYRQLEQLGGATLRVLDAGAPVEL